MVDLSKLADYRVDLVLFIYCFSLFTGNSGTGNLILQKTCFPDGPPGIEVLCNDTQAVLDSSYLSSTRNTLREVVPGLVVLFAGAWRDYTGLSRPLLIMAHIGEILSSSMALFSSLVWDFSSWATVIVESLASGLLGSRALVTVACLSYITDHTPNEQRASRLSVILVSLLGGISIATAAGGFLLNALNYSTFYIVVLVLFLINMVLAFFSVKDGPRRDQGGSPFESLKGLRILIQPKPNRLVIWLLLICSCVTSALLSSEATVSYGFFQNVLHFTPQMAGVLGSYRLLVSLIMAASATPILIKIFKLSEFTIALICVVPSAISCFLMSFAKTLTEVFIYYALDMMRIVQITILWSIITKGVKKSEIGVYASFLAFGEAITPLAFNPLYLFIFEVTLTTWPGAFFLLSGSAVSLTGILIWISSRYFVKLEEEPDEDQLVDKL